MSMLKISEENKITKFLMGKDFISLLNCIFGLYSIYFAFEGSLTYSAVLMILAVVADILDGIVARQLSKPTNFGKRMDMADLVSFGAAPAIFILIWLGDSPLLYVASTLLVTSVIFRLARFQAKSSDIDGFVGVPSTTNGLLFPLLYVLNLGLYPVVVITLLMSFLMLSSIVIPIKSGRLG